MSEAGAMVLRVGVIENGRVVEERLLRDDGVHSFGGVKVFEKRGVHVTLLLEQRALHTEDRGRVRVSDDVTVLFHFVPAPAAPKRAERASFARIGVGELEPIFTAVVIASFMLHAGIGVVVKVTDPARAPEVEELRRIVENIRPPRIDVPRVNAPSTTTTVGTSETAAVVAERERTGTGTATGTGTGKGTGRTAQPVDRGAVRQAIAGRGLLAPIGGFGPGANAGNAAASVFGARTIISDDVTGALDRTQGGVRMAQTGDVSRAPGGAEGEGEERAATIGDLAPRRDGERTTIETGEKRAVTVKLRVKVDDEFEPVSGTVDSKAVRETLRRRAEAFQDCYSSAMKGAPSSKIRAGKVLVEFTIDEGGRVSDSQIVRDGIGSAELGTCVKQTLKRIRFDAPEDGEVTVSNSFVFQPG